MTDSKLFDLSSKTALVTGSSGGLGLGMAKGLAEAGAHIVLNGRDADKLAAAAKPFGKSATTALFDVADEALMGDHDGVLLDSVVGASIDGDGLDVRHIVASDHRNRDQGAWTSALFHAKEIAQVAVFNLQLVQPHQLGLELIHLIAIVSVLVRQIPHALDGGHEVRGFVDRA